MQRDILKIRIPDGTLTLTCYERFCACALSICKGVLNEIKRKKGRYEKHIPSFFLFLKFLFVCFLVKLALSGFVNAGKNTEHSKSQNTDRNKHYGKGCK